MFIVKFFTVIAASFIFTRKMIPVFIRLIKDAGFIRPNYREEYIPLGIGIVFFISSAIVLTTVTFIGGFDTRSHTFLYAAGLMALFGLIDDIFGSRHASGLAGHLKKIIFEGQVTTGALKALAGIFTAFIVSAEIGTKTGSWLLLLLINIFTIALSINAVNLLDLRPGRAGKGFFLFSLFLISTGISRPELIYLASFLGSLAAFMPYDLRSEVMMGDAGSNTLGFVLGYTAVFVLDLPSKVIYFFILAGLHLLTEKYSLTRIIEKNRVLNYIDMMGRKQ